MKRFIALALSLICFTSFAVAQSSIRFGIGYGFPVNSELIGENETYDVNTGKTKVEGVYGTLGSGFSIQAGISKPIKASPLGLDLELRYVVGKKYEFENKIIDNASPNGIYSRETGAAFARSIQLTPSISITAPIGKPHLYTRVGAVIAFTTMRFKYTYMDATTEMLQEQKTDGEFSLGFRGAVGIIFNPIAKFQFFSEINFSSLTYTPKHGEITNVVVNGNNITNNLTYDEKHISYKKDYKYNSSTTQNINTAYKFSLGSAAFQAGVKIRL